jgi:NADPH:quinone reductase-like Zn-dependent oxidoreductase
MHSHSHSETSPRPRPTSPRRALRGRAAIAASAAALCAGTSLAAEGDSIRQWQFASGANGGFELVLKDVARPTPARNQVAVRVHAVSLNRRDLLMLNGRYGLSATKAGGIPLSDGAGEVVAVGADVKRFKVGDRVASIFFEQWIDGPASAAALASARGGNATGMLSEVVVADPESLVAIPKHLSYEEAATLPCTGVTAWVALFRRGHVEPGQFVLLEGTGGVSVIGLQLSAAAGAKPIITSSSDAKLQRAKDLGAFGTVNYRTNADWQNAVRALTGGAGVDQVLEVGGKDTLPKALQALAYNGHVALIGGLSGFASDVPVGGLLGLTASVSGIYVGSRADFEALNEFVAKHRLKPVVDRVFPLEEAPAAFAAMEQEDFVGKIVIRL